MELTLEEAAEYLGMSPEDLKRSRKRGLPPGYLGYARDGQIYFNDRYLFPIPLNQTDEDAPDDFEGYNEAQEPQTEPSDPHSEDVVNFCFDCGRDFSAPQYLDQHIKAKHLPEGGFDTWDEWGEEE